MKGEFHLEIVDKEYIGLIFLLFLILIAIYFITDAFLDLIAKYPSKRKDNNKITDLYKFINLLKDIGIGYEMGKTGFVEHGTFLRVVNNETNGVDIMFDQDGNFVEFQAWMR